MTQSVTSEAIAAIDDVRRAHPDWRDVAAQVDALPPGAAKLADVLRLPEVAASAASYRTLSAAADTSRDRQQSLARVIAISGFLVAVLSGLLLYWPPSETSQFAKSIIGGLQAFFIVVAVVSSIWLAFRKPLRAWTRARSAAEAQRLRHFQLLLSKSHETAAGHGGQAVAPYLLEYVRAYLIEDQKAWFARRSRDYGWVAGLIGFGRFIAIVMMGLAGLPALLVAVQTVLDAGTGNRIEQAADLLEEITAILDRPRVFTMIALVGGALQTLMATLSATSLALRNRDTYRAMAARLDGMLGEPLAAARAAAAIGDRSIVEAFWRDVAFELAAEHREWGAAHHIAQVLVLDNAPGVSFNGTG
ncbi:MAG: hypothetical protein NW205_00280 [Hyphomicrobiaceae bacterium]|nr:hypothetical protein [Hyphomicrobiaceae bacterium]